VTNGIDLVYTLCGNEAATEEILPGLPVQGLLKGCHFMHSLVTHVNIYT